MSRDTEPGHAQGSRAFTAATIGWVLTVVAYVVDLAAGPDLAGSIAGAGRAAAVIGAVVCAGVLYQLWSTRAHNDVVHHAAVAAALLGGALTASSVFSAPSGQIFGSPLTAVVGVAGLAIALVAARPGRVPTTESRP